MVEKMNILMAVNAKYLPQMKSVICSLGISQNIPIDFYLMHHELSHEHVREVQILVDKYCKGRLTEIKLDTKFLQGAKVLSHFSLEMYYRIFASDYLPQDLDRILWLDADLVVIKDIKSFYEQDFQGKSLVACGHRNGSSFDYKGTKDLIRLGIPTDGTYFNSGVLLINLEKIRKNFNSEKVCELIEKYESKLEFPDQDILNIMYYDDVLFAPQAIYNYQVQFDQTYGGERRHIIEKAAILHFTGGFKPWDYKSNHFAYRYYWDSYEKHGSKLKRVITRIKYISFRIYLKLKCK